MTQKEKAIECLKKLNIYEPFIEKFIREDVATLFEGSYAGYYLTNKSEEEVAEKVKQFEERTGSLVYAVTHEKFWFGECYSFLCVSKYEEDWDGTLDVHNDKAYAFAYVWNKDVEEFSEYGTIVVDWCGGGIRRIS